MAYCTEAEVYAATKLTTNEVPEASVTAFIEAAEEEVDHTTYTTYWKEETSATADSATDNTLTDTGEFAGDDYTTHEHYVWIYGGTGSGQVRKILSHTDDILTVDRNWSTNPDNTSTYRIIYTATVAYESEAYDGTGDDIFFLQKYPLRILESLTIDTTSITTTAVYQYPKTGKLILGEDAEASTFQEDKPQTITMAHWWGVFPLPPLVKRFTIVAAAMKTLAAQIGGTHNIPSTYQLPEGSVTIGQAYVNIRETYNTLKAEYDTLTKKLIKYPAIV